MKKTALILCLLLLCAWKYSGAKEVEIKENKIAYLIMTNGSEWQVYELDEYRVRKWQPGDKVKLIESRGFYAYEWLGLNKTREDVVHLHCINDGREE